MLYAELDKSEKTISLKGEPDASYLLLTFLVVGEKGEKINLKNVDFGYQLKEGDRVVLEESWPPKGIRFELQDPGAITVVNEKIKLSTDYQLLVWYSELEHRSSDTIIYNSGMPPKEYDSMVWNEETHQWDYAKPYPAIEGDEPVRYFWNEDILDWEEDVEYQKYYSNPEYQLLADQAYAANEKDLNKDSLTEYELHNSDQQTSV